MLSGCADCDILQPEAILSQSPPTSGGMGDCEMGQGYLCGGDGPTPPPFCLSVDWQKKLVEYVRANGGEGIELHHGHFLTIAHVMHYYMTWDALTADGQTAALKKVQRQFDVLKNSTEKLLKAIDTRPDDPIHEHFITKLDEHMERHMLVGVPAMEELQSLLSIMSRWFKREEKMLPKLFSGTNPQQYLKRVLAKALMEIFADAGGDPVRTVNGPFMAFVEHILDAFPVDEGPGTSLEYQFKGLDDGTLSAPPFFSSPIVKTLNDGAFEPAIWPPRG